MTRWRGISLLLTIVCSAVAVWSGVAHADDEAETDVMIANIVKNMTREELLGQKIILGPPWIPLGTANDTTTNAHRELRSLVRKYKIGNFMLADINYRDWHAHDLGRDDMRSERHNKASANTIHNQARFLRDIVHQNLESRIPPIISADFEGGVVQHFRDLIGNGVLFETPSPMNYAATRDRQLAHEFGTLVGELLRRLGLTTNFAPLVDVTSENELSIIGTRAFSSNEDLVQGMAISFSQGLSKAGIAPVLKHWPGLGTIKAVEPTPTWNRNTDIHELDTPLTLRSSVDQYEDIYRNVLADQSISPYPAVMTAHVYATQFAGKCGVGQNIVTFCSHIVRTKLREDGVKLDDKVVISDDFAYLRATRSWGDGNLSSALKAAFDAGHDMVIIGSLYPNAFRGVNCEAGGKRLGCGNNTVKEAIRKLYEEHDFNLQELRASVTRILKWKFATYRTLIGTNARDEWQSNKYVTRLENIDNLLEKLEEHSKKVFEKSLVIVGPSRLTPDNFTERLNVGPVTKIHCVAPTYQRNDLMIALKLHYAHVQCTDLGYSDEALQNEDEFIEKHTQTIISLLESSKFELFIFGLVNKPAHLAVWKNVFSAISSDDFKQKNNNARYLLVAFSSPAMLNSLTVGDDVSIVTTFSNSKVANRVLVDALRGQIKPIGSEYLPVSVKPFNDRVNVNPVSQDISLQDLKTPDEEPWWLLNWYNLVSVTIAFFLITFVAKRDWRTGLSAAILGLLIFDRLENRYVDQFASDLEFTIGSVKVPGEFLLDYLGPLILVAIVFVILDRLVAYVVRGRSSPTPAAGDPSHSGE